MICPLCGEPEGVLGEACRSCGETLLRWYMNDDELMLHETAKFREGTCVVCGQYRIDVRRRLRKLYLAYSDSDMEAWGEIAIGIAAPLGTGILTRLNEKHEAFDLQLCSSCNRRWLFSRWLGTLYPSVVVPVLLIGLAVFVIVDPQFEPRALYYSALVVYLVLMLAPLVGFLESFENRCQIFFVGEEDGWRRLKVPKPTDTTGALFETTSDLS